MDDLFRTLTLSNVSGDALGTAMDILGSDWSNSSDWSGSQEHEHEHTMSPFMEPDRQKSGFSPMPNLATVTSEFSRSSSSNWSQNEHSQPAPEGSNRLQLSELIGRGAFGSVYRGSWKGREAAIKVVEHDNGLLGECDELDMLATGMDARSHLDTAGSSMNGNTAVMLEAALSSAVMHQNVVQTYDYQTRSSSLSGGQETYVVMECHPRLAGEVLQLR
ncbi:hypothetical protein WJX82_007644 [Trebouxia sp. C0006]